MANKQIMIVEDEGIVASHIQMCLENLGYTVPCVVASGKDAIPKAETHRPDLVLMDVRLKGEMDGIEAAYQIYSRFDIPVIYLTAYADESVVERAKQTTPFGYIIKPFKDEELRSSIEIALFKHNMEKELKAREAWLFTTLKSIGDAVITTNTKGYVTFMNPTAESLCGWTQKEAWGKPLEDVFNVIDADTGKAIEDPVSRVLTEGVTITLSANLTLISKGGTRISVSNSLAPIKNDKGNILGGVLVFKDTTEQKKMEDDLRRLRELIKQTIIYGDSMAPIKDEGGNIIGGVLVFKEVAKQEKAKEDLKRLHESIKQTIIQLEQSLKELKSRQSSN